MFSMLLSLILNYHFSSANDLWMTELELEDALPLVGSYFSRLFAKLHPESGWLFNVRRLLRVHVIV
jgi:hypothetical protein